MTIDTTTIRRLRDALIANGRMALLPADEPNQGERADGKIQASVKRVAPFVETMYLMMIVDGELDQFEQDVIRGALRVLTHGVLREPELEQIIKRCEALAREQGVEARLEAVGSRLCADRMDREMAFSLAAAVAMADQTLAQEESSLVDSIAQWYGISSQRRAQILQQFEGSA